MFALSMKKATGSTVSHVQALLTDASGPHKVLVPDEDFLGLAGPTAVAENSPPRPRPQMLPVIEPGHSDLRRA